MHRETTWRWAVTLGVGGLLASGCAEEKTLPARPITSQSRSAEPSLETVRPAKEDPAAREIVTRALAAHTGGHPEKLDAIKAQHLLMQGTGRTIEVNAREVEGARESWSAWPDRFAFSFDYKFSPERELVMSGAATPAGGYVRAPGGSTSPLSSDDLKATRWDMFALEWTFTPKALLHPDAIFHQPGAGVAAGLPFKTVKAFIPGQPEWSLRFGEATHLLQRLDYVGLEGGRPTPKALVYSEHVDREGLKVPGRVEISFGSIRQWDLRTLEKYEAYPSADKIDAKKFELP